MLAAVVVPVLAAVVVPVLAAVVVPVLAAVVVPVPTVDNAPVVVVGAVVTVVNTPAFGLNATWLPMFVPGAILTTDWLPLTSATIAVVPLLPTYNSVAGSVDAVVSAPTVEPTVDSAPVSAPVTPVVLVVSAPVVLVVSAPTVESAPVVPVESPTANAPVVVTGASAVCVTGAVEPVVVRPLASAYVFKEFSTELAVPKDAAVDLPTPAPSTPWVNIVLASTLPVVKYCTAALVTVSSVPSEKPSLTVPLVILPAAVPTSSPINLLTALLSNKPDDKAVMPNAVPPALSASDEACSGDIPFAIAALYVSSYVPPSDSPAFSNLSTAIPENAPSVLPATLATPIGKISCNASRPINPAAPAGLATAAR